MLRAEGIGMPGSNEATFIHRFYRIPCVGFLPQMQNIGWFTIHTACLGLLENNYEQTIIVLPIYDGEVMNGRLLGVDKEGV